MEYDARDAETARLLDNPQNAVIYARRAAAYNAYHEARGRYMAADKESGDAIEAETVACRAADATYNTAAASCPSWLAAESAADAMRAIDEVKRRTRPLVIPSAIPDFVDAERRLAAAYAAMSVVYRVLREYSRDARAEADASHDTAMEEPRARVSAADAELDDAADAVETARRDADAADAAVAEMHKIIAEALV